jgi:hypothetical protein
MRFGAYFSKGYDHIKSGLLVFWTPSLIGEIAMSDKEPKGRFKKLHSMDEDWLAVIIGLVLVGLVWIGVITNVPWPLIGG